MFPRRMKILEKVALAAEVVQKRLGAMLQVVPVVVSQTVIESTELLIEVPH